MNPLFDSDRDERLKDIQRKIRNEEDRRRYRYDTEYRTKRQQQARDYYYRHREECKAKALKQYHDKKLKKVVW